MEYKFGFYGFQIKQPEHTIDFIYPIDTGSVAYSECEQRFCKYRIYDYYIIIEEGKTNER